MASSFQQQSLQRKLIYFGLILALFTGTLVIRRLPDYGVEARAKKLELREEDLGQVELTGSALRLTLTGSRGVVVCYLWMTADEKKKKHEWNELELVVRSVIKLQPHFVTPWKFQSWNLAYNVSVELDRVKDKFFYITRGIQFLAEGAQQNRDNPDLRYDVGFYTQNKFGISDEHNTLRSLFQMSCIDPIERDPARFRRMVRGRPVVDLDRFEDFCRNHPFLVRRLNMSLRCKTPDDVVEFLAANQKIPSRCQDRPEFTAGTDQAATPLKTLEERFPVLPPASRSAPDEITHDSSDLGDDFDNYAAARAWYGYAQDPLLEGHRPKWSMIIFQSYPSRAQVFVADQREQEGWFDDEGWEIRNWFFKDNVLTAGPAKPVTIGDTHNWAGDAWERAYQMYRVFAEQHRFFLTPEERQSLSAAQQRQIGANRHLTQFDHHYYKAEAEKNPEALSARKTFFKADRLRKTGNRLEALQMYEDPAAFGPPSTWSKDRATGWKRLFLKYPLFQQNDEVQEESYRNEQRYLTLVRALRGSDLRQSLAAIVLSPPGLQWLPVYRAGTNYVELRGPLEDVDSQGYPLLSWMAKNNVRHRMGLGPDPEAPPRDIRLSTPDMPGITTPGHNQPGGSTPP